MRNDTRFALALSGFALCFSLAPCQAMGQNASVGEGSENASQMCMRTLWKALIPLVDAKNGYIVAGDLERIAKIKLPPAISIGPNDAISSLEWKAPYSISSALPGGPAFTGSADLSLRLEVHNDPSPIPHPYSWQRMQRRINGTKSSNLDLTCIGGFDTLTLREAEADLEAIGLKRVGALSQPQPVEVFYQDLKGRVDLYYDTPVNTVPAVISIHISGAEIKRRPAQSKFP
jgi:hypothetical protein